MARLQERYAIGIELWVDAIRRLDGQALLKRGWRTLAARTAMRAAAAESGVADGRRWREHALAWLRAELQAWNKLASRRSVTSHANRRLAFLRTDPLFAPVRDDASVAGLPDDERNAWQALWAGVEALLTPKD